MDNLVQHFLCQPIPHNETTHRALLDPWSVFAINCTLDFLGGALKYIYSWVISLTPKTTKRYPMQLCDVLLVSCSVSPVFYYLLPPLLFQIHLTCFQAPTAVPPLRPRNPIFFLTKFESFPWIVLPKFFLSFVLPLRLSYFPESQFAELEESYLFPFLYEH